MPLADRPSRYSQCGRILEVLEWAQAGALLSEGGWISASTIFCNLPVGATIHSRISELRKVWGFEIEHETRGPGARGSFYRLALRGEPGEDSLTEPSPVSLGAPALPGAPPQTPDSGAGSAAAPESLTLFGDERTRYEREQEAWERVT